MPIEKLILSQKFYNQIKNGDNFDQNTSDYSTCLIGNVGEKIRCETDIQFLSYAQFIGSDTSTQLVVNEVQKTFTRTNGSWFDDGFSVGDELYINWYYDGNSGTITNIPITSISDEVIYFDTVVTLPNAGNYPETEQSGIISWCYIYNVQQKTAALFRFGLVDNDEEPNFTAKFSDSVQEYYAENITTNYVQGQTASTYKDWVNGQFFIKSVTTGTAYQRFILLHDFVITPYYLDGQQDDILNRIAPDDLIGDKSYRYTFEVELRRTLKNPNTATIFESNQYKGNVGWFNENFNSFNRTYFMDSITYKRFSDDSTADGLLITTRTKVQITASTTGAFNSGDRFGLMVSYLPSEEEYSNTATDFAANWMYDYVCVAEGSSILTSGIIKSLTGNISGGKLIIDAEIEYTTAQQTRLDSEKQFIIAVNLEDSSDTSEESNRTMMLCDVNYYDKTADITDLAGITNFRIFNHPQVLYSDLGNTDALVWNEDGVLVGMDFYLNTAKSAEINSASFDLVAYNTVTGEYFKLDTYEFNLADAVTVGTKQNISIDTTRGYQLASGSQFNKLYFKNSATIGALNYYLILIGQKFAWEDWIKLPDADVVFYDNTKTNNNLNKKSSNYSLKEDYEIRLALSLNIHGIDTDGTEGDTDYFFLSPTITVNDYDEPTTWTGQINTFHPDTLVNLGGAIRTDGNTLFQVEWTDTTGDFVSIDDMWAIHRIEETGDQSKQIQELSTIWSYPSNNKLIPTGINTQLDMYIYKGKVYTECLIDSTKLIAGKKYNISARLDNGTNSATVSAKITEAGDIKITEDGDIKVIE